jgi:acyl-CoA reductase-like NAD-dependent aldehyde dehydrogenase
MLDVELLVGGRSIAATDGRVFERTNPVTSEIASRSAAAGLEDARAAGNAAAAAFPAWSAVGPDVRGRRLARAAEMLLERLPDFSAVMTAETGCTKGWAAFNVRLGADMFREASAMTTRVTGEVIPSDRPGMTAFAIRRPAGAVLAIAPWNAPVILGARAIAMPLACGNTVILKASEMCPATHRLIGDVMEAAGLCDGVVNVVTNAPDDASAIVEALIAHPAVRRVNFTGSTRVGRIVAEVAARHLKPVLLELGGKAPFIVLDDADLDEAVAAAAFGAFTNQGQICMATERVIVDDALAGDFASRFAAKAAALTASDPGEGRTPLGAIVSRDAVARIEGLIRDAVQKGARVLAGGAARGVLMDATVLDHVTPSMRIYREESFGPVAAIVRAQGVEDAIRIANDTEYGLSSAVFGRDVGRALMVANRLESGICHINGATVHDEAQMPFGGVKASGYGRFGGTAAIQEFTDLRWVTISSRPGNDTI